MSHSSARQARSPDPPRRLVQFGEFDLDFKARTLKKHGTRLRLPNQAFLVLEMLIENNGQVVTREDLCKRVWPTGTFVDYDHGLNVMVNKVRETLGDSAKEPRFIETIAKRGYRFVASVTVKMPKGDSVRLAKKTEESLPPVSPAPPMAVQSAAPESVTPAVVPLDGSPNAPFAVPPEPAVHRSFFRPRSLGWWLVAPLVAVSLGSWFWIARSSGGGPGRSAPGTVKALTTFPGSKDFCTFSPDGRQFAFAWVGPDEVSSTQNTDRTRDIYVKLVDAGEPLRLTRSTEDELLPSWSPDGGHVAFLRRIGSRLWVYTVPALGGPERRICEGGPGLSWSPDGKTLAMADPADENNRNRIMLYSLETGERKVLTEPGTASDGLPSFSPDGRNIAFVRSFTYSSRDVMVVPAMGGEAKRLTFDQRPVWGLTWSPDSKEILFSANRSRGEHLWRIPAKGGTAARVPVTSQNAFYPSMSRQIPRLAYTEVYTDTNLYLYEGQPQSGSPGFSFRQAVAQSTREDTSPQFSPDGQRIAFVSSRTGNDEIWVCRWDGQAPLQLTSFDRNGTGSPRWSPDGRWIAFDSRAGGSADIWIVDSDGNGLRQFTADAAEDTVPAWSGDGRWIYYRHQVPGRAGQIWKRRLSGGDAVAVTNGGALEGWESPDGKLFYFTRDRGQFGIWAVPVDGGEERRIPELSRAGYWRSWGVIPSGLVYVTKEATPQQRILFYSFLTRRAKPLLTLEHEPLWQSSAVSMSPDGKRLLIARLDQAVDDLMMVEDFR